MNKKTLIRLATFVVLLVILRYLFGLRISIVGSLLLTLAMTAIFRGRF